MVDMSVNLGGLPMKNPVTTASGTFAAGMEYSDFVDVAALGAVTTKGVSLNGWEGNASPRIAETPSGMLNSIGLQNPGVAHLKEVELPWLAQKGATTIVNVSGHSFSEYVQVIEALEDAPVDAYEVNISCPNVDAGGMTIGTDPNSVTEVVGLCRAATKRPLIVAGHGIRLAGQVENLAKFSEKSEIPIATTFNGYDVLPTDDKNAVGRIGTAGQRAANFILQNSDCVLFLGTRNNVRQVSYNWENFAKRAYKIVVDIDPAELQKPLVKPDLPICADLKDFFPALAERLGAFKADKKWLDYSKNLRAKYAFENVPEYRQEKGVPVNVYNLTHTLTAVADPEDIFVVANGSPCICTCQCAVTKKGQRMFLNSGDASMGYDLPAAIGAAVANPDKKIICYTGDGSIMMNIQELQTIKTHNLPIRIFIIRNDGYSSIKQTHKNFFNANYVGCNAASGVETPDFCKVANAFGIDAERIENADNLEEKIRTILKKRGPYVCEIVCQNDYMFSPKLSAKQMPDGTIVSPSLEDMYPFLDRKEFESNMIK